MFHIVLNFPKHHTTQ